MRISVIQTSSIFYFCVGIALVSTSTNGIDIGRSRSIEIGTIRQHQHQHQQEKNKIGLTPGVARSRATATIKTFKDFKDKAKSVDSANADSDSNSGAGRYAIHFITGPEGNVTKTTAGVDEMAATAIVDMMQHIKDPLKHGVTSAVLAGLYVVALISLIVFATTGSIAFICSFSDCRNFFLGMKPEASPRPFDHGHGPFLKKRGHGHHAHGHLWNGVHMQMQPVVQALYDSFDKFGSE